jgi:hypothetical protein
MPSPVVHRRLARTYLARAAAASTRDQQTKYLRFAVSNSVRAQRLEAAAVRDRTTRKKLAG